MRIKEFKEKVALITGAGSGFGKEFAKEAFRKGMRLFLADINQEAVAQTAREIREAGGTAEYCVADVSLESGVNGMIDRCMTAFGQIDLLINNAGILMGGDIETLPFGDWEWAIQLNCMSQVYALKRAIPIMEKQGTDCHIVNVASIAGLIPSDRMPAYNATKSFSVSLSESVFLALLNRKSNVKLSVFCPGTVKTNVFKYEEYRPERFSAKDDAYYSSETYRSIQQIAKSKAGKGAEIDGIAASLFEGIEAEQFYILPHPMYKPIVKIRMGNILNDRVPDIRLCHAIRAYEDGNRSPMILQTIRDAMKK